jgi:hypothetical protein
VCAEQRRQASDHEHGRGHGHGHGHPERQHELQLPCELKSELDPPRWRSTTVPRPTAALAADRVRRDSTADHSRTGLPGLAWP